MVQKLRRFCWRGVYREGSARSVRSRLVFKERNWHYASSFPVMNSQITNFHYILLCIWKSSSKTAASPTCCWLNCFSRAKESFREFAKWLQKTESCPQFLYIFSHRNPVWTLWEDAHQTPSLWLWKTEQVQRICSYQNIFFIYFKVGCCSQLSPEIVEWGLAMYELSYKTEDNWIYLNLIMYRIEGFVKKKYVAKNQSCSLWFWKFWNHRKYFSRVHSCQLNWTKCTGSMQLMRFLI